MSYTRLTIVMIGALALPALAQERRTSLDPLDPVEKSSAVAYQSAFANYRPLQEFTDTPDKHWRAINEEVARVGGHMGILKEDSSSAQTTADDGGTKPMSVPRQMHHQH